MVDTGLNTPPMITGYIMSVLTNLCDFAPHENIAIIGSGGKTTTLWHVAENFRHKRVLVTPTTKLFLPKPHFFDYLLSPEEFDALQTAQQGISLAGQVIDMTRPQEGTIHKPKKRREVANPDTFTHKVLGIPQKTIQQKSSLFNMVIMECDGARNLPLKGWAPYEPVIPEYATTTLAIIPLWCLGVPATSVIIHRLDRFLPMAQCAEGAPLTLRHLAHVIAHPTGLMAQTPAKGRTILFLHLADQASLPLAQELYKLLPQECLTRCERVIAGSAKEGWGQILV